MMLTEMISVTAVTTVYSRRTLTRLTLTTMEKATPVPWTLMVMVSGFYKFQIGLSALLLDPTKHSWSLEN